MSPPIRGGGIIVYQHNTAQPQQSLYSEGSNLLCRLLRATNDMTNVRVSYDGVTRDRANKPKLLLHLYTHNLSNYRAINYHLLSVQMLSMYRSKVKVAWLEVGEQGLRSPESVCLLPD